LTAAVYAALYAESRTLPINVNEEATRSRSIRNQTGAIVETRRSGVGGVGGVDGDGVGDVYRGRARLTVLLSAPLSFPPTGVSVPRNSRAAANARGNPPAFYTTGEQAPGRLLRVAEVVALAVFSP